jgi:hypothetical protein
MKKYTHRTISGVSTVAIAAGTIGSALLSMGSASAAVVALPTCDAAITDAAMTSRLAAYNASKTSVYKSTAAYKLLKKKVTDATTGLKKANAVKASTKAAKATKAKKVAAATKVLNTAKANESKAVNAVYVKSYSASVIPAAVAEPSLGGNWIYGQYTTRVFVRNGVMIDLCYSVDESDEFAHNNLTPESVMTEEEKLTSLNDYQNIDAFYDDPDAIVLPLLPTLRTEALKGPAKSRAAITNNLVNFLVSVGFDAEASDVGAMTGATYSIRGFHQSLQAALVAAKLPA